MKHEFKTNINCGGCVATVTPHLNGEKAISNWKVDTQNPQKVLTVETDELNADQVCALVQKAGFKAEPLQQ
ncbi:MAG: copper chaperone [Sphingobacteriales bacterium]|nr:MAG: copper chaperone [Sphingobacteriales bacterium]